MSNSHNIKNSFEPFNPLQEIISDFDDVACETKIHIRLRTRNARKCVTTIEGLDAQLDLKKMIQHLRRTFNCSGTIIPDEDTGMDVLQFSGDQRHNLKAFLLKEDITQEANIIVHGY